MRQEVKQHTWRAVISEAPPSNNVLLRTHFRKRKELREVWYALLYSAFFHEGITRATGKRSIVITIRSKRERDELNNTLGADKLICDNLKRLGWIVDDSPKWCDVLVTGEVGDPQTVVEVRG